MKISWHRQRKLSCLAEEENHKGLQIIAIHDPHITCMLIFLILRDRICLFELKKYLFYFDDQQVYKNEYLDF